MSALSMQLNYIYSSDSKNKRIHLLSILLLSFLACYAIITINAPLFYAGSNGDNFTKIFETNAFRGSFQWLSKMDWLGMIMQFAISVFSVVGVCLMCLRIITSMLYLSSRGLWEEVSEIKKSGGDNDLYDLGLLGQLKKVGQGKQGTGMDAILSAFLILLPDVKRYSDFADGRGEKFDENISFTNYMLKIAIPTVMCTFFFAMGFNGTLFKALAVTVDAMGTLADKVVSQNYAAMVNDLIVTGKAYKFAVDQDGTVKGEFQGKIAREIYAQILRRIDDVDTNTSLTIGANVEKAITEAITPDTVSSGGSYGRQVKLTSDDLNTDSNWGLLGYTIIINSTPNYDGAAVQPYSASLYELAGGSESGLAETTSIYGQESKTMYAHVYIDQVKIKDNDFFNKDALNGTGGGSNNDD